MPNARAPRITLERRRRQCRIGLCCLLAGVCAVNAILAFGIECRWLEVRDPAYADLIAIARQRRREMPDRPLAMILGSSSTFMGLEGDRLSQPGDVLFLNCGISGAGPINHQILLRRFLADGVRPDLLFVEIMPHGLSCAKGDRLGLEEQALIPERFTCEELARAKSYSADPFRHDRSWMLSRLAPAFCFQAELRRAARIDLVPNPGRLTTRDDYGFNAFIRTVHIPTEEARGRTEFWLEAYRSALENEECSESLLRAVRDLFALCREERLRTRLVLPPLCGKVLQWAPGPMQRRCAELAKIADEFGMPTIDARNWVDDDDFADGVHMQALGAERYSDRFRRDALVPALAGLHPRTAQPTVLAIPVSRRESGE
jgi:hypothetical protein